jgi:hypothetical protein
MRRCLKMASFPHPDLSIGPVPGDEGGRPAEALVIDIRPVAAADHTGAAAIIGRLELALELDARRGGRASDRRIPYRSAE